MPFRGAHWDKTVPWDKAPERHTMEQTIGEKRKREIEDEGSQERVKRSLVTNI